jgi:hypothetical protein
LGSLKDGAYLEVLKVVTEVLEELNVFHLVARSIDCEEVGQVDHLAHVSDFVLAQVDVLQVDVRAQQGAQLLDFFLHQVETAECIRAAI